MSTFHVPPGIPGLIVGLGVFPAIGVPIYLSLGEGPFNLDPRGLWNGFEPFLAKYLRLGEFVVGLATGSIVLLVGSSALRGQGLSLPWYYASPLYILCSCALWGIGFMVWLTYHYEDYQHGEVKHTRKAYALSLTLGFSSLVCFLLGYAWLIFMVTMQPTRPIHLLVLLAALLGVLCGLPLLAYRHAKKVGDQRGYIRGYKEGQASK